MSGELEVPGTSVFVLTYEDADTETFRVCGATVHWSVVRAWSSGGNGSNKFYRIKLDDIVDWRLGHPAASLV